jgi:diaminopimelate epimerase
VEFTKMSGAGNDFVILGPAEASALGSGLTTWIRRVCRRGLSVGADGVLTVEPSGSGRVRVRFFNPDGGEAFCGNGSRCAARFARLRGFAGDRMILETTVGDIEARILDQSVRLALPPPRFLGRVSVDTEDRCFEGITVHAGVPHFVVFFDEALGSVPLDRWGSKLHRHPRFAPHGTNVDLARRRPDGALGVRTWERGVDGETLSCGTGAVAVAFAERLEGGADRVQVVPASGVPLRVTFDGPREAPREATLEGDARLVFEGSLDPEGTTGFPA